MLYGQVAAQILTRNSTVCIALNGVAPWLWIPLAKKYGRRPVYLCTTLLGFGTALACAYTHTYAHLIVARVFNGFFPVAFALGATTVTDLFPNHQRGRAMGFFTITMSTGSHVAPIVGGLVGQYLGWRWIFKFVSIVDAFLFITSLFCLPETLYVPPNPPLRSRIYDSGVEQKQTVDAMTGSSLKRAQFTKEIYFKRLGFLSADRHKTPPLSPIAFLVGTFKIIWYPSVILPALYYSTQYGFASILPAVTVAAIFTAAYKWSTLTIGLTYGAALTIGGILGEFFAGWVVDLLLIRAQNRRQISGKAGKAEPEVRLWAIWPGEFLVPAALLIYGFALTNHAHVSWFAPIFAIGLGCFGLQIITTTCYTYSIDCYRDRAGEVAQVFNFTRQIIGMTFAFYSVNLGEEIGWWALFLMYSLLGGVAAFIGVLLVMWKGREWRSKIQAWEETRTI